MTIKNFTSGSLCSFRKTEKKTQETLQILQGLELLS